MAKRLASNKKVSTKGSVYGSYVEKLESQVESNQSRLSMILGALIILVVGILVFNYFNKNNQNNADLGPAQQTEAQPDVAPESLPGKYTVKEGDTLFTVAETYYKDGYKYTEIVKVNKLANADEIEVGQVLEIPKVEGAASVTEQPQPTNAPVVSPEDSEWGSRITGNSYTVVAGDWLSKIAGRAYGDIYAYQKIAGANKIMNPDAIEVGTVLSIPR